MVLAIIFFSFLLIYIVALIFYNITSPELRWDWGSVDVDNIKFPKDFIHQNTYGFKKGQN